jgi:hypothetical protein
MKKICVVTGSSAEYGLLRWVMNGIMNSQEFGFASDCSGNDSHYP